MDNYIEQALRTKSDKYYLPVMNPTTVRQAIDRALTYGKDVDDVKKSAFYGKPFTLSDNGAPREFDLSEIPEDVVHGILGVFTEAYELLDLLFRAGSGCHKDDKGNLISFSERKKINPKKVRNESGDLLWYLAILFDGLSKMEGEDPTDFDRVMRENIVKLRARYPDKFDAVAAIHKDEDAELAAVTT